ncbi:MAG TPA: flagellar assembly protein FliW [Clostridiales bacterium]|nr:flagellar assembly protein FliW [Clostridiales bacterium]
MLVKTKHFGDIELDESKVIIFEEGIMGLEGLTKYALIFDEEEGKEPTIYWLQSLEDPAIALPVVSPFIIKADYNPLVQQQLLEPLGEISEDGAGLFVLLTLTIPKEVKDITANLKAPFVINSDTQKGCQIIAENEDYDIKFRIYDILQEKNAKESEGVKEGEN